jgi:hypothetical protein
VSEKGEERDKFVPEGETEGGVEAEEEAVEEEAVEGVEEEESEEGLAPPPPEEEVEGAGEARARGRGGRKRKSKLKKALKTGESFAYSVYDSLRGKQLAPAMFFKWMGQALMGLAILSLLVGLDVWATTSIGSTGLKELFLPVSIASFPLYFAFATALYMVLIAGLTGVFRIARGGLGFNSVLWALASGLMGYEFRRAGIFVAVGVTSDIIAQFVFLLLFQIIMVLFELMMLAFNVLAVYTLILVFVVAFLWIGLILGGTATAILAIYPFMSLALAYIAFRIMDRYIARPALKASDASLTVMALVLYLSRLVSPAIPVVVAGAVTIVSGMVSSVKTDLRYMKPAVTAWGLVIGMSMGPGGPDPLASVIASGLKEYGEAYGNGGAILAGIVVDTLGRI